MRKPGGGVQGTYVSTWAEVAMKTLAVAHITLANIIVFTKYRKAKDAYKEPT
jgi:hypothetical protein